MWKLELGDCREVLRTLADSSASCVVTDPVYPCVQKSYGVVGEDEWHEMMREVVAECKRVVSPSGSAVFILQPTGEHVGQMRLWLYEFILYAAKMWNLVQDVIWFNTTAMPNQWCNARNGLLRPSVKYCVWLGPPDCYRNQTPVMWLPGDFDLLEKYEKRCGGTVMRESGYTVDDRRITQTAIDRGCVTPFNVIMCAATAKKMKGDKKNRLPAEPPYKHPARTPEGIAHWWLHYICPEGGTVLDPFAGVATIGVAALKQKKHYIGIEKQDKFYVQAKDRLEKNAERYRLSNP